MEAIKHLKMNLVEHRYPFFSDEELQFLLDKNGGDIDKASYEGLILKAETTGISVSGLTTEDSSAYFKMLAANYITPNTGALK